MLTLILQLDKDTYTSQDEVRAEVKLANSGDGPVLVNARLALNSPDVPEPFREIHLVIADSAGVEPVFAVRVRIGEPEDTDFKELAPGQSVQRAYALRRYYAFDGPGRCTAWAVYENRADPSTGSAWKGTLASNTVSFMLA